MTVAPTSTTTPTPTVTLQARTSLPAPTLTPTPTPTPTPTAAARSNSVANASAADPTVHEVPANATCLEFLHLMKAFSESAVNVTEMAQRVDSLAHQDEQLLRLLPLATTTADECGRGSTSGSVADTTDDESSSASGRRARDRSVDGVDGAAADVTMGDDDLWQTDALKHGADDDDDELDLDALDVDLVDSDDGFRSDEDMDVDDDESMEDDDDASTDVDSTSQPRIEEDDDEEDHEVEDEREDHEEELVEHDEEEDALLSERRAQEDLQRWMELELDLDSTEDPYDASLHLPGVGATLPSSPLTTHAAAHASSLALGVHAGSHANSSSVLSTTAVAASLATTSHRGGVRGASSRLFDRTASVTAALFDDDDDDDGKHDDVTDRVLMTALLRKKHGSITMATTTTTASTTTMATKPVQLSGAKRTLEQEATTEDDAQGIWGMEVDSYEHDLLSSIDHSVLCDRENRFLQWDLEIEAATAAAVAAAAELRTPPSSLASSGVASDPGQKLRMASSPRELKSAQPLRSPSNVDTNLSAAEDWGSLDFGTFQNRTVSHILSSCLHKRKLHHPYKDRVTLVNFNVPGGEPIGPVPAHNALPSGAGSLLFGAGLEAADVLMKSGAVGLGGSGSGGGGLLAAHALAGKDAKLAKGGEKKAKKPRVDGERKKTSKSDPFAEFDAAFSDDHEGRAGLAAKLAMTKLENLPLPDLTNLPQDLKELKRKIEATEHKVEGTKHRHRKGGPCPRCQVQNQLRAAKRAYHKRAVAHKKLPQLGAVSPALTATAVVVTPPQQVATSMPSPPTTVMPATSVATTAPAVVPAESARPSPSPTGVKPVATPVAPAISPASVVRPATVPVVKPTVVVAAVLPAAATVTTTVSSTAAFPPPKAPTPASSCSAGLATATVATTTPFPRRSCGENALASPFASPASVASSGSAPSSPESASPQVHQVTVTSA